MSHWYDHQGHLHESVPYADPCKGYRDATLADARKHGWLPSVTTVLQILSKPGLVRWQVEQGIRAALSCELAMYPEQWDEVIPDIHKKSQEYVEWAADFGSATHYWVNRKLLQKPFFDIPPMFPCAEEVAEGFIQYSVDNHFNWTGTELRVANTEIGCAGTIDLLGNLSFLEILGDIKTQEEPLTPHEPEYPLQLAGYALLQGLSIHVPRVSFICDRTKPGSVKEHWWIDKDSTVEETNRRYNEMFLQLLNLWFLLNRYDPRC